MSFKRMACLDLRGESTTWFLNPHTPPGSKALFWGGISAWKQRICPFCHSARLEILFPVVVFFRMVESLDAALETGFAAKVDFSE